uniref:Uncharacterized protein n=1 Tax=Mus musculus TaxID=10090 RepID=Q3TLK8_MOUSE|nr:unnamed protein product [Mus musculus]
MESSPSLEVSTKPPWAASNESLARKELCPIRPDSLAVREVEQLDVRLTHCSYSLHFLKVHSGTLLLTISLFLTIFEAH